MSFRKFIEKLIKEEKIEIANKEISKKIDAAGLFYSNDGTPILLNKIKESKFRVAGNIFSRKDLVAKYFEVNTDELIPMMVNAIENPSKPKIIENAVCQEVEINEIDLDKLPILFHVEKDGGNYVSSGVIIAKDKELGQNVSFHRCMQIDKKRFSVRILERHLHEFIQKNNGKLDVALCIGNTPQVLLAGATSTKIGVNELEIANSIKELEVVKAKTSDILIPADTEFVLEGTISNENLEDEGPFVDLTATYDGIRKQMVFEVKKITHRKNAIWHALMPGGDEHRVLMGMPKEPTIFQEVNKVTNCIDVNINSGGCSWLHAIIKINKQNPKEGKKAIDAAFEGHKSLKHAFIVDEDIDIYNPNEIEWAMSTRFQGNKDIVIKEGEKGSSLDPSSETTEGTSRRTTTKVGFDLTIPSNKEKKEFLKANFPKTNLEKYRRKI